MISLKDIEHPFEDGGKVQQLKKINLDVEAGEVFGIIGGKGSGKSTLIRCVNLLERPNTGIVSIDKQNLSVLSQSDLRHMRSIVGLVERQPNLLQSRTVFDNIALPLKFAGFNRREIAEQVTPLLAIIGMADKQHHYPNQLSAEQQIRVSLARAVVNHPSVLLLDEFSNLVDMKATLQLIRLVKQLRNEYNLTILLTTQKMEVLKGLCDGVGVMADGNLIEQSTLIDFLLHPQSELGREFIRFHSRMDAPSAIRRHFTPKTNDDSGVPVVRLAYTGMVTAEALISHVIEAYHLRMNILQGHQEVVHQQTLHLLLSTWQGADEDIQAAFKHLRDNGLYPEVIAYVPRNY